jgi:hypothetical protein
MSAAAASSCCAAIARSRSRTRSAATATVPPIETAPRLANVPLPAGATACRRRHAHALHRDAEPIGDDLRDGRRVALAPARESWSRSARLPSAFHRERGRPPPRHVRQPAPAESVGAHAGVLRVAREPDADEPAARRARRLLAAQRLVVRAARAPARAALGKSPLS